MFDYKLTRAKRKGIAATVRNGALEVRAPYYYTQKDIDEFLSSNEKWITRHLAESKAKVAIREGFSLNYGDKVTYRGKEFPIVGKPGDMAGFNVLSFYMPTDLTPGDIKYYCKKTFRLLAEKDLIPWVHELAREMEVYPTAIKINDAKARWGSCSAKGSVNLAWRLIMADDEVIEYLITHELSHMIVYSHSPQFWKVVESWIPDYRERQVRLKALQQKLSLENWD